MSEALHLWHSGFMRDERFLQLNFEIIAYHKDRFFASYMFEDPSLSMSTSISIRIKRIIRIRRIIRIFIIFFELYT